MENGISYKKLRMLLATIPTYDFDKEEKEEVIEAKTASDILKFVE